MRSFKFIVGKKAFISVLLSLFAVFYIASQNSDLANSFKLYSGDGLSITNTDLEGEPFLCFYDTKETAELNRELKNVLSNNTEAILAVNPDLKVLGVADCTSVRKMFVGLWNDGLIKKSEEEGQTVYGDWDGAICRYFNFVPGESNFLIADSNGDVLYQTTGYIPESEISVILDLLLGL